MRAILLLVFASFLLAGCPATLTPQPQPPVSPDPNPPLTPPTMGVTGEWLITRLYGQSVAAESGEILRRMTIGETGNYVGFPACNTVSGQYQRIGSDRIDFGEAASTRALCRDETERRVERQFLQALQDARRFDGLSSGELLFYDASGNEVMRLRPFTLPTV